MTSPSSSERPTRVLLGVSGGIAAFKAVLLLRVLKKAGFDVKVVMTEAATRFVGVATLHALSGHPVISSTWQLQHTDKGELHVELAEWADAVVIYPATSHIIGSLAAGLNDDVLQLCCTCATGPVILSPAMHTAMARSPQQQAAEQILVDAGYRIVPPVEGLLANGKWGYGRLPEPESVAEILNQELTPSTLEGRTVLVTAGPTREALDPVRFISNRSSGRMGFAVARQALRRGARVVLISGPTELEPPQGVELVPIESAAELSFAVKRHFAACDALVMTAAVADFTPRHPSETKIKKEGIAADLSLALSRTDDILTGLGDSSQRGDRVLVGFAMETGDLVQKAWSKLKRKKLDLIVANDLGVEGAGFGTTTNVVSILWPGGGRMDLPRLSKDEVAGRILGRVEALLERRSD